MAEQKISFLKSVLISLGVLGIVAILLVGITMLGFITWISMLFLFYWGTFHKVQKKDIAHVAISGTLGLITAYSMPVLSVLISPVVGISVLLILVLFAIAVLIHGSFKYIDANFMMICTIGSIPNVFVFEQAGMAILSYIGMAVICYALMALVELVIKNKKPKEVVQLAKVVTE